MVVANFNDTSNLRTGSKAPEAGIYVVIHRTPSHALAHEVLIRVPIILLATGAPMLDSASDARFSFKGPLPIAIEDHEFFQPAFSGVGTLLVRGRWAR
jgi:hypothetical protein